MDQAGLLETLERLRGLPREAATVEFKGNVQDPAEIGQYLSALANSAALEGHDRGWLVWGVEDGTHTVKSTTFDPFTKKGEGNQALVMWLQQKTSPKADFTFHECHHTAGKVILLEIHPPRTAPIAFSGIRYIRIDSHKTRLSEHPDKEARLWGKLGQLDDWSGEVVSEATLDDLDAEAVEQARLRFTEYLVKSEPDAGLHEEIRRKAQDWDVPTLLNKARLTKTGRITCSALLLLGKEESAHWLSPADTKMSWVLRDADGKTVSSQHFWPPFLLTSDRIFARIRNVMIEQMPDGTLFPTAIQQYDPWVIRETLHNAVAHQDYRLGGKINIVEYPDRLVFANLGQFIPPSVEWMLEHQSPPEHYRNQWLIDGMIRLRMIDQVGSGIRRMFETQRGRFLPLPDYSFAASESGRPRVEVTIAGQVLDTKYTQTLMKRSDLDLRQVLLLDRVQKGVMLSKPEAAQLKRLGLIEGRYPRLFVSGRIAAATGGQAQHIRKRGFDNRYYRDLLVELIREHGPIGPGVITELFMDKLPDSLDDAQKRSKIRNLTFDLAHRRGVIENVGKPRGPGALWQLRGSAQTKPAEKLGDQPGAAG
jgi:ATP-dependent DNA helicase RecG